MTAEHIEKARAFRDLHREDMGFVMPNAWDAGSAVLLAAAGFDAIATTSAGIAFSMARQDYQVDTARLAVPRDDMFGRMRAIVEAVPVPVNGDLEAGYGDQPEDVARAIGDAIAAGLAGGNIEDRRPGAGLYDEALAVERIVAARERIGSLGSRFVLTARSDVFQLMEDGAIAAAVRRSNLYLEAGADCAYTPGARDLATHRLLAREIAGPLNVVLGLGGAGGNVADLLEAGVKRISLGGTIARATLGFVRECARELRQQGTLGFTRNQIGHAELNALFARSFGT